MHKKLSIVFFFLFYLHSIRAQDFYLFIGTYTEGKPGKGIYVYKFNSETGKLTAIGSGTNIVNPSYITISPGGKFIYACTETKSDKSGTVSAFTFDKKTGQLGFINKQLSGGANPVYLTVHRNNKWLVNGNYTGGSVSVFPINDNGSLEPASQVIQFSDSSVNKSRQEGSHIHATVFSPEYKYVFIPDLGADKIRIYSFNESKEKPLEKAEPAYALTVPGSGPRHFTFHPGEKFAYSIEELSGTVSVYSYNKGKIDLIQRLSAHDSLHNSYASADIHISPEGEFLYASNRGEENNISIFSVDQNSGKLKFIGLQSTFGSHPRNFIIDPTGNFLLVANLASDNVVVFKRDKKTGSLKDTGEKISVPRPSCLQMLKIETD